MTEFYAITVWSFSAFYNTRKVGAKGSHRAAPVSRYLSCAWSSNTGSGVMKLGYHTAMYAPFRKSRTSNGSALAEDYSSTYQKHEDWYLKGSKIEVKYPEDRICFEVLAPIQTETVKFKLAHPQLAPKFGSTIIAPQKTDNKYEFTIGTAEFARGIYPAIEAKRNAGKFIPFAIVVAKTTPPQMKVQTDLYPASVSKAERMVATVEPNVNITREYRKEKIISLINSVALAPVKTESVCRKNSKVPNPATAGNPSLKLNKLPASVKYNIDSYTLQKRIVNMGLDFPADSQAYLVVKKIVEKLRYAKKKAEPKKVLEYAITHAKEKRYELRRKSLALWRILWANINGKWLMLIIDDATKIIVGVGVFASIRAERAIKVVEKAITSFGAPKAVINHEDVFLCAKRNVNNACKSLEEYLSSEGIEYLASVLGEGAAFLRAQAFVEYVCQKEGVEEIEGFANLYNLKGIGGAGRVSPAFANS